MILDECAHDTPGDAMDIDGDDVMYYERGSPSPVLCDVDCCAMTVEVLVWDAQHDALGRPDVWAYAHPCA